jgi:enoyl-CoA hydratase/carnithine racemase
MPEYSTIMFVVTDKVAHLMLNRPEAANSLNATVSAEMMDAVVRCEDDTGICALVVSGAGRVFCAGADLRASIPRKRAQEPGLGLSRDHLASGACGLPGNRRG